MKKQIGKNLMQKWKNKIRVRLSALDKKKLVLTNIPYALAAFYADRAFFLYRNSPGEDMGNKLLYAMEHADRIFAGFVLSNNWKDLLAGIVVAVVLKVLVWQKQADAKKLRKGIEYGSARWGNAEDIKPYMSEDPWMNIPLTATEALTMESRPKQPKYARNKNIVVIGGSGSGKTRFFVKPSVMQMNCSMVITDPKGTLIEECGKMLAKGPPKKDKNGNIMKDKSGKVVHEPYVIKVLNTINFSKSLHYNPFAYIRSEKDILKLVTTIIVNTKGEGEKASEDFWVKAEKLLYTALIAFIWYEGDEEEKNLNTLLDLLNESETREEDETYQNPVDMMFQELEERDPQHFAVRQYKKYKMAAGYTAKCLFISGSRVPSIPEPNPIYHLPDEAFKRELGRFEGTPKEILENQELLDFFLPMLRADFTMDETYYDKAGVVLHTPISAFGGEKDDEADESAILEWGKYTDNDFNYRIFPGGHFYLRDCEDEVISEVMRLL